MKNKFPKFFIIFTSIILGYIFYKSEIVYNGESRDIYYKYFIICFFSFFTFFLYFFLSETLKLYFRIIFFSLITSFYVFEIFLNYFEFDDLKKKIIYKYKFGKKYDARSKVEVYQDLKKKEIVSVVVDAIFPTISSHKDLRKENINFELQPLSGHSNLITIYCKDGHEYSTYMSDRYGFNNPDYEWDKEKIDFLLVGDSFVHGACVNRPYDIASQMRENGKYSVLNLGYWGNSTLTEYATLREYLRPGVKNILLFFWEGNDLSTDPDEYNLTNELKNPILNKYLENKNFTQNLIYRQSEIDNYVKVLNQHYVNIESGQKKSTFVKNLKLFNLRFFIFRNKFYNNKNFPKKINKEFYQILNETKNLVSKNGSKFYFIYLPEYNRYLDENYSNELYFNIKNIVKSLGIDFIDIKEEIFNKENIDTFWSERGMFKIKTNEMIAQEIINTTNNEK